MSSNNDFTDEERVVVLHHLSRGSSLNDVLRLLLENLAKNRTELEVEGMVEACNNQQENQRKSRVRGPERHGEKWNRDAVDGVIADLARNMPNGRVEELMNIQLKDEITVQNVRVPLLPFHDFRADAVSARIRRSAIRLNKTYKKWVYPLESSMEPQIPPIRQVIVISP